MQIINNTIPVRDHSKSETREGREEEGRKKKTGGRRREEGARIKEERREKKRRILSTKYQLVANATMTRMKATIATPAPTACFLLSPSAAPISFRKL